MNRQKQGEGRPERYLDFDIFSASLFRLKSFRDTLPGLDNPHDLGLFLSQQTEIEHWTPDSWRRYPQEGFFSSSLLPRLSDLEMNRLCFSLLEFAVLRPLVYLSIKVNIIDGEDDPHKLVMEQLCRCNQTLHHFGCSLFVVFQASQILKPAERIGIISQHVPGLRTLSYKQEENWMTVRLCDIVNICTITLVFQDNHQAIVELTGAIWKFDRLENLRMKNFSFWEEVVSTDDVALEKGLAVARKLFQRCPSLRHICYYDERQQDFCASYRRLDGGEPAYGGTIGFAPGVNGCLITPSQLSIFLSY